MRAGDSFALDIEKAAGGEPILGIVVGGDGWGMEISGGSDGPRVPKEQRGLLLTWAEARPMLDYPYDAGYGSPECHKICAWTDTRVIFVSQYDGSTDVEWMPRHPGPCDPEMPGG